MVIKSEGCELIYAWRLVLLSFAQGYASTPAECLNGNFKICREIFNKYGAQSDRKGAVELFEKACSAQTLNVSCQIISISKVDSLKKTLELAKPDSGIFIMNGAKVDKFYQISEVK